MSSAAASEPAEKSIMGFTNLQSASLSLIECQTGLKDFSGPTHRFFPKCNAKKPIQAEVFIEEMNRTALQVQLAMYRVNKSGGLGTHKVVKTIDIPSKDYKVSVVCHRMGERGTPGDKYEFALTPNDYGGVHERWTFVVSQNSPEEALSALVFRDLNMVRLDLWKLRGSLDSVDHYTQTKYVKDPTAYVDTFDPAWKKRIGPASKHALKRILELLEEDKKSKAQELQGKEVEDENLEDEEVKGKNLKDKGVEGENLEDKEVKEMVQVMDEGRIGVNDD